MPYSILSPEGFASILYKDASKAEAAANDMKLTAGFTAVWSNRRYYKRTPGGAHTDYDFIMRQVRDIIRTDLKELMSMPVDEMLEKRYMKFRKFS